MTVYENTEKLLIFTSGYFYAATLTTLSNYCPPPENKYNSSNGKRIYWTELHTTNIVASLAKTLTQHRYSNFIDLMAQFFLSKDNSNYYHDKHHMKMAVNYLPMPSIKLLSLWTKWTAWESVIRARSFRSAPAFGATAVVYWYRKGMQGIKQCCFNTPIIALQAARESYVEFGPPKPVKSQWRVPLTLHKICLLRWTFTNWLQLSGFENVCLV